MSVQPPTPSPIAVEHCDHLSNLLPQRLESLRPRVISPRSSLVHAWGDPAIVLSCGVGVPAGYSARSSETTVVNGVTWFQQPGAKTVVWTALRPDANVRLLVPTSYADQGSFLVDLADPLKTALPGEATTQAESSSAARDQRKPVPRRIASSIRRATRVW